ncbi:MAG: antirestriction protein [Burkholderiales bacterium]|nr:antirestriction protein [Burkholderiales bacterium]
MQDSTEETLIARTTLDDAQRMSVPAALFGVHFATRVEPYVFGIARTLSEDYDGGYWDFHTLSNGAFYMAPAGDERFDVRCENGFDGELSADALGITCCLYAYSHLSFAGPDALAGECARQYHLLREYVLAGHGESPAILAAID